MLVNLRAGSPYANGYTENIDGFKLNTRTCDFDNSYPDMDEMKKAADIASAAFEF